MANIFDQAQIDAVKENFVTYINKMSEFVQGMTDGVTSINGNWQGTGADDMVTKGNTLLSALKEAQQGVTNIKTSLGIKSEEASTLTGNLSNG